MRALFFVVSLMFSQANAFETFKLSESSLGPLNEKTQANLWQIKKLFKGYKVKTDTFFMDGEASGETFRILQGDEILLEINANTVGATYIYSVIILDPKIKTPDGIHLGSKLEDLVALKVLGNCTRGAEEAEHEVRCTAKGGSNFGYAFLISAEEEEKTEPGSPVEIAIQPKRRILSGLTWHPPRKLK